jgi:aminoglycoside 6'-N-acetyltransferase I
MSRSGKDSRATNDPTEHGSEAMHASQEGSEPQMIERCLSVEHPGWLDLRERAWPRCPRAEHLAEMAKFISNPERFVQFVAYAGPGRPVGLAEAAIRTDYVNGAHRSPVPFLEGLFVLPKSRRQGFGSGLVAALAAWALAKGFYELASDAHAANTLSHLVHKALGFQETERVVFFRKALR